MNLQQLKVFVYAARYASLTEAAEELSLKQPTASFHLKKLEESVGVELLRKNTRQLALTDAGRTLLPYAKRICALLDESARLMQEHREQGRGQLKIVASYTPATYFLPLYLAAFQADHVNVVPTLTVKQAGEALGLLRQFEVDVAIVSLMNEKIDDLEIVPLAVDELKLLLSSAHPLAKKLTLTFADLAAEDFLVHEHGSTSRELSELWAKDNGFAWHIRMELGAIETIKESVKHGIGIGILPWRSVAREVALGELAVRDLPGIVRKRSICLAYRKEDVLARHVRTFIEFMKESCGN